MTTYTIRCELLAKETDVLDYTTLVFKNLDKAPFGYQYCMLICFPRWESRIPDIGEIGFVTYDDVCGGVDSYYDRDTDSIVKYNYDNLIFKKFVEEKDNSKKEIIL